MRLSFFLSVLFVLIHLSLTAQIRTVKEPTVAQQTHTELKINEIQFFQDSIVVQFAVANKLSSGGWFCADKNTYIEDVEQFTRRKVIRANGIPWCPNTHKFNSTGEVLNFSLTFPALPGEPELLNIVEVCDKACFSLKGIILNEKLNRDIRLFDEGTEFYVNNQFDKALEIYYKILEELPTKPTHVYGYSYSNVVRILWEQGKKDEALSWMKQLELSGLPNSQYFIENLKKELSID